MKINEKEIKEHIKFEFDNGEWVYISTVNIQHAIKEWIDKAKAEQRRTFDKP